MSAIAFLSGALVAMIASCKSVSRAVQVQQEILKRGVLVQGKILRLWRPPVFGAFTRIYFEFEPDAEQGVVRSCHVDRRSLGELAASLPSIGASVSVRYLPENPTQAVIAKLVSRFVN
ncbi:MAG: DUF3592 domain-containing protein [Steroidobacter sp.]